MNTIEKKFIEPYGKYFVSIRMAILKIYIKDRILTFTFWIIIKNTSTAQSLVGGGSFLSSRIENIPFVQFT